MRRLENLVILLFIRWLKSLRCVDVATPFRAFREAWIKTRHGYKASHNPVKHFRMRRVENLVILLFIRWLKSLRSMEVATPYQTFREARIKKFAAEHLSSIKTTEIPERPTHTRTAHFRIPQCAAGSTYEKGRHLYSIQRNSRFK